MCLPRVIEAAPQVVHLLVTRGEPRQLHALTALSRCKYCALLGDPIGKLRDTVTVQ